LAQVPAALQPDAPQIVVEILQGAGAAHFHINPELLVVGRLGTEMEKGFFLPFFCFCLLDNRLVLWAS
jgi:hypothetical protein